MVGVLNDNWASSVLGAAALAMFLLAAGMAGRSAAIEFIPIQTPAACQRSPPSWQVGIEVGTSSGCSIFLSTVDIRKNPAIYLWLLTAIVRHAIERLAVARRSGHRPSSRVHPTVAASLLLLALFLAVPGSRVLVEAGKVTVFIVDRY